MPPMRWSGGTAIVGPPRLSWLLQDQILSINIITPLTPYQRRTGSYKPVDRVLLKLWYWLQLFEGDLLIQQVPCKQSSEEVPCTFGKLKPSTQYCVRTVAAGIARQRSREVEQCLVTPAGPAGFPWVPAMLSASFLLLLLSVAGLCFMQLHVFPSPPETHLPKALVSDDLPPASILCVAIAKPGFPAFAGAQHLLSSNSHTTKPILVPRCLPCCLNYCPPRRSYWWRASASHGSQERTGSQAALGVQHSLSSPSWQGFGQLRLTMPLLVSLQALQNSELSVPPLQLEENPLALLLQTVLPSYGPSTAGQASTVVPQLLRGLNQDVSGYCDNGFGPDCPEGRDPSCTQRVQLGHALGSQVPSQLEKDGEAGDGDDLPEQLVLVGLTGSSYIGDRDSQIPEIWLPLHFQLYSKCQCPVLGAGSHLPLPVPRRSCSQEYLQESLGTAEHWIRLSSVKLPSSAEEEGEQLPCAPQPLLGGGPGPQQGDSSVSPGCSAQAAPRVPSPCQPPPSPRSFLRAVAFSGYEPRAPSGSEP
ncbi:uncharacterized protein FYW23_011490 isoform 1-T1 [Sylvia borin]